MFNRSGRAGNYAYAVSRVKAKKALLLKDEDYNNESVQAAGVPVSFAQEVAGND